MSSLSVWYILFVVVSRANIAVHCNATSKYSKIDFPPTFIFGSATSAYQVEGAAFEDGRTPSIWDTFAHAGLGYSGGETGDVACDHYHKYKEDVELMAEMGLDAYRFSISWSRLIPNGRGPINPKGLQYYNNLIDKLLSHGIQPHVTLVNYDHPQALEDEYEGWLSRKKDFVEYADVCFREFGDRVKYWTTVNEPNVYSQGGYDGGLAPPRRCSPPFGFVNCTRGNSSTEPYTVAHHILLAHASAVRLYREKYQDKQHGFVGFTIYTYWYVPYTDTKEDIIATQRANDFLIGWVLDPLVFGDYPETMKKIAGSRLPSFTSTESEMVKGSFDFIGVIHFFVVKVKDDSVSLMTEQRDYTADQAVKQISDYDIISGLEVPATPEGLEGVLDYLKRVYGNPPVFVYENGYRMLRNSTLEDTPRVEYLQAYIGGLLNALRNGSNTRGYFAWSFLDAFELFDGYNSAFGLFYVDMDDLDLKRHPKLSARWYSQFLKGNTIDPEQVIGSQDSSSALFS